MFQQVCTVLHTCTWYSGTHMCVSLFGENLSLISRCRWMARCGTLMIGRLTWTRWCSSLSPLCEFKPWDERYPDTQINAYNNFFIQFLYNLLSYKLWKKLQFIVHNIYQLQTPISSWHSLFNVWPTLQNGQDFHPNHLQTPVFFSLKLLTLDNGWLILAYGGLCGEGQQLYIPKKLMKHIDLNHT